MLISRFWRKSSFIRLYGLEFKSQSEWLEETEEEVITDNEIKKLRGHAVGQSTHQFNAQ